MNALSSATHQLKQLYSDPQAGEEWVHVQHAFSVIQLCGDMMIHMQTLSEHLNSAILSSAKNLQNPASSARPFHYYDYLAVYHPEERTAAIQLLTAAQKGQFCQTNHLLCDCRCCRKGGVVHAEHTDQSDAEPERAGTQLCLQPDLPSTGEEVGVCTWIAGDLSASALSLVLTPSYCNRCGRQVKCPLLRVQEL